MKRARQLFLEICSCYPHKKHRGVITVGIDFAEGRYALSAGSPQRVHSKGVLPPKGSHKCYFSTIHPLAMKGQTLLFTFQSRIQSVRRFGAISFGVLAYFAITHPLPNHCPVQWRITAREDARPPSTAAKRPMTERETPHEEMKTLHVTFTNAP